jgi:hypothetical protein
VNGITGVAVLSLQGALLGLLIVAVRRENVAATVNAFGALLLALLPALLEFALPALLGRQISLGAILPLWIAIAGVLHTIGMLGAYETTWWWDHLTHTVSAALVAALVHAVVIVSGPTIATTAGRAGMVTLAFTAAIGVLWELVELVARDIGERLDVEPVLVHYGWRDTAADLGFDVVGALLVVGVDLRTFVPIVEQVPGLASAVLVGSGGVVVGGSLMLGFLLGILRATSA